MIYTMRYHSPIGNLLLAQDGASIVGLWVEGQKYFLGKLKGPLCAVDNPEENTPLWMASKWLDRYFAGERPSIHELPLAPEGSAFARLVWQKLTEIPYGTVTTYGEIARQVAVEQELARMSAQAVGGAVGHNPISIIIPCHRVIGSNGSLTGFASGVNKKLYLLSHEGIDSSKFRIPKDSVPRR